MDDGELSSGITQFRGEEEGSSISNEKVYVAVSKDLKACKSTLLWALQNSGGKMLSLVHVHQPAQTISILGGRFSLSSLSEGEVKAHQKQERLQMCNILDEYLRICTKAGVQAEKLYVERKNVENGLVELISRNKIARLVMGAAADNRYSRKMMEPKSKKANSVRQHAPDFCRIWFVCKGRLICTREGTKCPLLNFNRRSDVKPRLTQSSSGWFTTLSRVSSDESFDDFDQSSTFSLSHLSALSRSPETPTDSMSAQLSRSVDRELPLRSLSLPPKPVGKQQFSPSPNPMETSMKDSFKYQLDQAVEEIVILKQETFRESYRRHQAEKEAIDAICKANEAERSYHEEFRRRKELEAELFRAKEELKNMKNQRDMALEELQIALEQNGLLNNRGDKSDNTEQELRYKPRSLKLLHRFRQL